MSELRTKIVAAARACIGTPFVHQARVIGSGLDCIGLVVATAKGAGIEPGDLPTDYPRISTTPRLLVELRKRLKSVDDPQPGDVLLFWFKRPGIPQHLGIMTDLGVVHAYESGGRGTVVEHRLDKKWRRRIMAAFRMPGVED